MGTLIAMSYPTPLFANAADHTYVKCGTGKKAWGCWGGKSGGTELRQGTGSTKRADKIAQPDEKAGIKCYLINGVCHQAANRILLPAGIIVRGARGYSVSEALFGTYGRVGMWPCLSPFNQYPGITGDLPECVPTPTKEILQAAESRSLSTADKLDWHYINGVLKLYGEAQTMLKARAVAADEAEEFHVRLFMYMAEFHLGSMLDKKLSNKIRKVRINTERSRSKAEKAYAGREMPPKEFVDAINRVTLDLQDEMANAMKAGQYESLFDLQPGERVILADPSIVSDVFASS
jgi:hypothetical protein